MKGSVAVKERVDWTGTTGEQWSMITTVDQRRKGGKKGQVLPRQHRPCVKHSLHTDWRVSVSKNELHQYLSLYVTVGWQEKCWETINTPVALCVYVCAWHALGIYSIWLLKLVCNALNTMSLYYTLRPSVVPSKLFMWSHLLCVYRCVCYSMFAWVFMSLPYLLFLLLAAKHRWLLLNSSCYHNRVSCVSITSFNMNHRSVPTHLSCFCLPCVLAFIHWKWQWGLPRNRRVFAKRL